LDATVEDGLGTTVDATEFATDGRANRHVGNVALDDNTGIWSNLALIRP
jgi:hypothetical protein